MTTPTRNPINVPIVKMQPIGVEFFEHLHGAVEQRVLEADLHEHQDHGEADAGNRRQS